jgi:hypothetical protein
MCASVRSSTRIFTSPPRATGELPFVVKATAPGPFQAELRIFLDTGYLEMPTVGIRGTAIGDPVVNDSENP